MGSTDGIGKGSKGGVYCNHGDEEGSKSFIKRGKLNSGLYQNWETSTAIKVYKKMKNIIMYCLALISPVFICSLYWVNKIKIEEQENILLTMENSLLADVILRQYEHGAIMNNLQLFNGKQDFVLSEILDENYKLIVWFSELQCSSCVDFVLNELSSFYADRLKDKLIVIGSFRNKRSYDEFLNHRQTPYPILGETESILHYMGEKEDRPTMFLLKKDLRMKDLFIPMKEIPYLMNQYLKIINNKLYLKEK